MSLKSTLILNEKVDAIDTPEAGKAHLYYVGSSIKLKVSSGQEFTLATGVSSEDVQDIVGNFIATGSNKLTAVYDDVLNVIIFDVDDNFIDHTHLLNIGTNTHAQLDAHVASTTNPHGVTAAQAGADPVGSASAAQAYAVQRSNHTGSQLASTISNFSAAVLSTIVAGIVFTANTAVVATDSVLEALGKLQAQINYILSVLATLVIGDNFQDFTDNTVFTTTANTNQIAATFTTALKAVGRYRVGITWDWFLTSTTSDAIFSVWLDGVQVSSEFRMEHSEANTQRLNNNWFFYTSFASITTHTLELRARAETAGVTVTVADVRAEIWRANA